MNTRSFCKSRFQMSVLAMVMSLGVVSGCYQRTVPPELTYDQATVEALETEVPKVDWE